MNLELLIQDLEKRASVIYEGIYSDLEKNGYDIPKRNSLVFNVIETDEINGGAWCFENDDYIEINKGVIKKHYDYFFKVNEHYKNKILKQMMPKEDEEEIANMSIEGVYWQNATPSLYDSKIIIDERTCLLNIFVSRFILVHEIGHIFDGHCSFLASKEKDFKSIPMYYSDDTSEKNVCPLDIRTMEMDADSFAVTQSMRYLVFLYKTSDTNVFCQRLKPMDLFFWWAFAIRSHFLLCEDRNMDSNKYNNEMRHLPSNARWGMILTTAMEAIDIFALPLAIQKSEIDEFKDQLGKGMFEAEKVFNDLKDTKYSYLDQFKDNKNFDEYSHEVHMNWDKLVNELKAHSRCPLYESHKPVL